MMSRMMIVLKGQVRASDFGPPSSSLFGSGAHPAQSHRILGGIGGLRALVMVAAPKAPQQHWTWF
jgi:hypothetical protein